MIRRRVGLATKLLGERAEETCPADFARCRSRHEIMTDKWSERRLQDDWILEDLPSASALFPSVKLLGQCLIRRRRSLLCTFHRTVLFPKEIPHHGFPLKLRERPDALRRRDLVDDLLDGNLN